MGKILMPGGGGGADLDVITASAGDVLSGKVIVDKDGEPLAGTLALSGTAADSQVLSGQTYYNTDAKTKRTGSMTNRGAVSQSLAINGTYTIPAGYHNGSGKVTQSIPTQGAATITPGTSAKTAIAAGRYASGNITVEGNANLVASNIKKGVTIFGVTGTLEQYLSSPSSILNGETWGSGITSTGFSSNSSPNFMTGSGNYIINNISGTIYIRTNTAVNLSSYKYLKLVNSYAKYNDVWNKSRLCVSTSPNYSGFTAYSSYGTGSTSSSTLISDITLLTGMYYVYIEVYSVSPYNTYKIYSITLSNT